MDSDLKNSELLSKVAIDKKINIQAIKIDSK